MSLGLYLLLSVSGSVSLGLYLLLSVSDKAAWPNADGGESSMEKTPGCMYVLMIE